MIWSIIVGGFIGFIAGAITKKGGERGRSSTVWYMGANSSGNGISSFYLRCSNCYCCCFIFLWEKRII